MFFKKYIRVKKKNIFSMFFNQNYRCTKGILHKLNKTIYVFVYILPKVSYSQFFENVELDTYDTLDWWCFFSRFFILLFIDKWITWFAYIFLQIILNYTIYMWKKWLSHYRYFHFEFIITNKLLQIKRTEIFVIESSGYILGIDSLIYLR